MRKPQPIGDAAAVGGDIHIDGQKDRRARDESACDGPCTICSTAAMKAAADCSSPIKPSCSRGGTGKQAEGDEYRFRRWREAAFAIA